MYNAIIQDDITGLLRLGQSDRANLIDAYNSLRSRIPIRETITKIFLQKYPEHFNDICLYEYQCKNPSKVYYNDNEIYGLYFIYNLKTYRIIAKNFVDIEQAINYISNRERFYAITSDYLAEGDENFYKNCKLVCVEL